MLKLQTLGLFLKKDSRAKVKTHRPVSLLDIFSKIY